MAYLPHFQGQARVADLLTQGNHKWTMRQSRKLT